MTIEGRNALGIQRVKCKLLAGHPSPIPQKNQEN